MRIRLQTGYAVNRRLAGFTLVELLAVISIVIILAAIAIPIMTARIDSSKWSEGKAIAGTLASAIRTWVAGTQEKGPWNKVSLDLQKLGINPVDIKGTYFDQSLFDWEVAYSSGNLTFLIKVSKPPEIASPELITLNHAGIWEKVEL